MLLIKNGLYKKKEGTILTDIMCVFVCVSKCKFGDDRSFSFNFGKFINMLEIHISIFSSDLENLRYIFLRFHRFCVYEKSYTMK